MSGCLDKSEIRRKVIGLGDNSYKKSYYPQLQSQIGELTEQKILLEKANAELTYTLDALKRTQESLAVNENKYHTLFENAGDAILIIDAASFELVDYNMKAMAFLGFQKQGRHRCQEYFLLYAGVPAQWTEFRRICQRGFGKSN
ncbi:hypothetical protein [Plebeiibacterium marinum]|uniref:PAS domain-containing protein n=1 Tax=Plebeiibacterium marinum TaxID=2992111 RepID=A0AAE3SLM7_9BACT|nr:hypothetical protein [Plebeiobacterium marinum]MCW3807803.1 hypothetical protein [Plebeiobacterium marinum]